jgi:hypothetical protein
VSGSSRQFFQRDARIDRTRRLCAVLKDIEGLFDAPAQGLSVFRQQYVRGGSFGFGTENPAKWNSRA